MQKKGVHANNNFLKNKRGAVELSISTIVVVVLAMSMLILGIVLVQNIFDTSNNAVNDIDQQVKGQISKLFGEDKKVVLYPTSGIVKVRIGSDTPEGFVLGIKNRAGTSNPDARFSYEVSVQDQQVRTKCGVNENTILGFIVTGISESSIPIALGDSTERRVFFSVPVGELGAPCTVRFRVDVFYNNVPYSTNAIDVQFAA